MELESWIIFLSLCSQWMETNAIDILTPVTTEKTALATTQSFRLSRAHSHSDYDEEDEETEEMNSKAMAQAKGEYWGGYYDFLINEGSYKFWAVFQLATAALLIYSGFAALYYAKVNPSTTDDYEDYFLRRRRRQAPFLMDSATFQRIVDALEYKINN